MSIDVEYAIKKDIRNNPVVRQIDAQQKRDLVRTTLLVALGVGMSLFAAWQHYKLVQHGYELQKVQQARAAEDMLNRKLRLEVETLKAPDRIEVLATRKLNMFAPSAHDTLVLQRAAPATPDAAVVAAVR
jgi:cell division protein FtsL